MTAVTPGSIAYAALMVSNSNVDQPQAEVMLIFYIQSFDTASAPWMTGVRKMTYSTGRSSSTSWSLYLMTRKTNGLTTP